MDIHWRYEFLVFFFNSSFILLYHSYKMCLPICKRMRPVAFKIYQSQWEIWWTWEENCATGMSFWSFSSILFSFCSIIATKYANQFSKGCTQWFSRYINFSGKWAVHLLKVRVFNLFLYSCLKQAWDSDVNINPNRKMDLVIFLIF